MLRMSTLFLRTLREDPADAEVASHRLLVRAGYIRRAAPGGFTWLPLGWIVYRNVERIIREEMDRAGFQEVHFPALLPREPYELSGRWTDYGDDIFRLKDRRGNDFLLAPTHEEMFTLLVKDLYSSYKDLPLVIYQIQTKYRDEARPRAGLLRGREFVMKDSYSFDVDDAGLDKSYQRHRDAYIATFERLGPAVRHRVGDVRGDGGIGQRGVPRADRGRRGHLRALHDVRLRGERRGGARADAARPAVSTTCRRPWSSTRPTPRRSPPSSIVLNARDDLRRPDREWAASDTLKNVIVWLRQPDGSREPLAIGVPGDRDVDVKRLEAQVLPAEVEPFTDADFAARPELVKGYIGPDALGSASPSGIRFVVDPRIVTGTRWVTGRRTRPGRHAADVVAGRDFVPDGVLDVADVRPGDACPACGSPIEIARGVEIGHIFQLGRRYAEALGLTRARSRRQAGHGHDGVLRDRRVAGGGGDRRDDARRRSGCAGRARWRRPTSTS